MAWAHPTRSPANVAPSSSREPLQGMEPWLGAMLRRGWIVVATDYAGLGTPGTQRYLSGNDEANDVVDSVRAVRHVVGARAGKDWVAWGASYGGHAVLWTTSQSSVLAPDLRLDGAAVAAPVADLVHLEHAQGQAWAQDAAKQDPPPQGAVPVLVVQGTKDAVVSASVTEKVMAAWCAAGANVTLKMIPGATHESVTTAASRTVVNWFAERLAGRTATSHC